VSRGFGPHAWHSQRIISYVAIYCVTLVRGIRMRERAYNFSAHFRVGRGTHRIVLMIVNTVTQPVKN
jgi:hypothetical protein